MTYNARVGNEWRSPTGSYANGDDDDFLGEMASQTPQHPIPTMQGAFEESMLETINEDDEPISVSRKDSVYRRKVLLERPRYERTVAGKWKQRTGEKYHPLWKIVAQISFGMHLLHQGLAKSDEEVMKILQSHVDEVDGFLERTTDDFELAQEDINERIRYLNLPLEHGDVFDSMLGDRAFRAAMVEGNIKIEHIIDRTQVALTDSLKDVKKGFDGTKELAKYLKKLERTWQARDEGHADVFAAMIGNTEGWTDAFVILQDKGKKLNESLEYLRGIISEIQRLVGIASRRDVPKPFASKSQASSIAHSKKGSQRASFSPPHSPQESREALNTAPILKPQAYGVEYGKERAKQDGPSSRSNPQVRYANLPNPEPIDARSQLPSRRASFSDRTRSITQKLSIRSPSKDDTAKDIKAARAYPQTAVEPKSAPWASSSKDTEELSSRHRKTQSMVSPHTPYDLDYILRVTPSDTTISPMRDSELSGLRSATNHLISPMSAMLGPRTAPVQSHPPQSHFTPQPLQPRNKRIATIQESASDENIGASAAEQSTSNDAPSQSLLRDMETTRQQVFQASAVRPLKPVSRELPLRDYDGQIQDNVTREAEEASNKPNIRASSIYSRTTDLKSMFSPPQAEKDNLMALLRQNTDISSVYDTDGPQSAYTEGTLSPPPAVSSAKPSPLKFGASKPSQFSEKAPNLEPRVEIKQDRNEDLFPPRSDSRLASRHPIQEDEMDDDPDYSTSESGAKPIRPPSPTAIANLTSATVTGPEPDFPFLSATVNGPEPDFFPFESSPAVSKTTTETSTTSKHPELVQRIAAATQSESTSSSSPPKPSLTTTSSQSSNPPPVAPPVERTRRRDVPPNLNLKLFPPPDQYTRATSPRSPRQMDLRPIVPDPSTAVPGGRSITPINPPLGGINNPQPNNSSNPSLLTVPYGGGPGADSNTEPFNHLPSPSTAKPPKSPGWRRVFSPGILTAKLRSDKDKSSNRKGHKRGGSSGDNGSGGGNGSQGRGGNGSNGRITPLIGDPMLKGSTVALPLIGGERNGSFESGGRGGGGSGRPSVEEERARRGLGGDGKPF